MNTDQKEKIEAAIHREVFPSSLNVPGKYVRSYKAMFELLQVIKDRDGWTYTTGNVGDGFVCYLINTLDRDKNAVGRGNTFLGATARAVIQAYNVKV